MSENQYYPKTFFSYKLVKEIMKEFEWSIPYEIVETGEEINAVMIKFPKCEIEIKDDGEGSCIETFKTFNSGKELNAELSDLIIGNYIKNYNPKEDLELEKWNNSFPNIIDTQKNIRNGIKILHFYFLPFILGEDYGWAKNYLSENES